MATAADLFNEAFYLANNADVAAAIKSGAFKGSAYDHYNTFGFREGRDPNALFDSSFYLLNNLDVFQSGANPLQHYFSFGGFEGRDPSPFFDSSYYLATNFDVANSLVNPLWHYINFGGKEGRDPSAGFDSSKYLADYADVKSAGVNPLIHFLQFGQKEGRIAFDVAGNQLTGQPNTPDSGSNPTLVFETKADTLSGTSGNDSGQADLRVSPEGVLLGTLQTADNANFAEGYDILTVVANGSVEFGVGTGPRATLTSLEEVQVEPLTAASNIDMASTTGLQKMQINRAGANLVVNNIASALTGGIQINNPVNGGSTQTFNFIDSVLSGTTDAITVTLNSANPILNNFGAVTIGSQNGSTAMETVNLISGGTAATNTLANIVGGATTLNLNLATAALTVTGSSTHTTVNVTGSKNLTWTAGTLTATTVAAGTFTGKLDIDLDGGAHNVTGGTGDDVVSFSDGAAGYTTADVFNGGAGNDRVQILTGDIAGVTASQTNLTNVEELEVENQLTAATSNFQHFNAAGINNFFFSAGANGGNTINYSSAAVTETFTGDVTGALTVDHTGVTGSDTINTTFNASDVTGALTFTDFESVNITSSGTADGGHNSVGGAFTATATGGAPAPVTLTGATNFDLAGQNNVAVINAGAFTGAFTMSSTAGSVVTGGATLTGGTGADRLVGTGNGGNGTNTTLQDSIVGGAGNDTIWASVSNTGVNADDQGDTLTGGTGNDTFVFRGDVLATMLNTSADTGNVVRITDFTAGSDKIALVLDAPATTFVLVNSQNVATAANLTAVYAGISAIAASSANTLQGALINVLAGAAAGTYLYVNDATGAVSNTDDMLLNITGITGTLLASDIVFTA